MALSTYDELVTSISTWAMRTGDTEFEAAIPDFILMAEEVFDNGDEQSSPLRTTEMEASTSIALTAGVGTLPTDYLGYITVEAADGRRLTATSHDAANELRGTAGDFFVIRNGTIETFPAATETVTLDYYQKIPALGPSNASNWLLAKSPRTYLFGSLLFSAPFMMDDQRMATFGSLYAGAISGITNSDDMSKFARAPIRPSGNHF